MYIRNNEDVEGIKEWWFKKRSEYNKGLIIGGFIAFVLYCLLGAIIIEPREEFEVTLFTTLFQGIAYLIAMGLANIFYTLGSITDLLFNITNSNSFRERLFASGYWFSVLLPSAYILSIMLYFLTR
jgi:hypothetical protein